MRRIKDRSFIALVLAGGILLGLGFFLYRLYTRGGDWAAYSANTHVYQSDGTLKGALVTDRNGTPLLSARGGAYTYAESETLRRATLHALGDHRGYLGAGALSLFRGDLAGYSFVNGTPGEGSALALSLDSRLQSAAWNALAGRTGAVIVLDYETGEILCMVSSPAYDPAREPDLSVDGILINRCTRAAYTPGSIFKLVTLIAAFENLPDLKDRTFFCDSLLPVAGDAVVCSGTHGTQTVEQALANSCNVAFGQLALELGGETLLKTARRLGVEGALPFYDTDTAAGRFDVAPSGSVNEAWSGIGQYNDLVTPYAMARLCGAIANGGAVREGVLRKGERGALTRLMDADTAEFMAECMQYDVVYRYGVGSFPGLDIAAKTGTAEVGEGGTHAWFAGFLTGDRPLAFAVVIEHGGNGLVNAGGVANAVLQKAMEPDP